MSLKTVLNQTSIDLKRMYARMRKKPMSQGGLFKQVTKVMKMDIPLMYTIQNLSESALGKLNTKMKASARPRLQQM